MIQMFIVLLLLLFYAVNGVVGDINDGINVVENTRNLILHEYVQNFDGEYEQKRFVEDSVDFLIKYMDKEELKDVDPFYVAENIYFALKAYFKFPWTQKIPWILFLNDVLPYASFTEPRDRWRPIFYEFITRDDFGLVTNESMTAKDAALLLNKKIWSIVDPPIIFVAAPADELNHYGVFEIMKTHNASCTGLAIFLVDALRCAGIPARVAGVPHWNKGPKICPHGDEDADCGNHNWVEVWVDGQWHFLDQHGEKNVLDQGWFYPNDVRFQVPNTKNHSIFSTSWAPTHLLENENLYPFNKAVKYFPMVWDWENKNVKGWDSTLFYLLK